jgi:DNA-binding transcriptional LysR family regulator
MHSPQIGDAAAIYNAAARMFTPNPWFTIEYRMDKLTSMAVLVKVVEAGSFAAAARQFRISPVMVGKHIRSLEEDLGVRLVNRTTRKLALTEAGQSYYRRSTQILGAVEDANQEAQDLQVKLRGLLRISTAYSFGRLHLAGAIAAFGAQHPELTIEVSFDNRLINLVEEGVDLAIRIGRLTDSSLISRRIAPCRMAICASPEYLKRRGVPRKFEDLTRHNCLEYQLADPVGRWPSVRSKGGQAAPVTGSVKSNSGDLLRALALGGCGIVRLPSFLVGEDLRAGRLTPLFPERKEPEIAIHAVYAHSRLIPAKLRAFIDFLPSYFGAAPTWDRWLQDGR